MADERHVAVLMVDLAGYTALTEAHGNVEAAHVVARYLALAADATAPGARLLERVGDGLVFIAERADAAVRTAVRLRALAARTPHFPRVRGGLHAGPVVIDEGRYVGQALNMAARVTEHAAPGQLLCTDAIVREADDMTGVAFRPVGTVRLKHVVQPVLLHEVIASAAGGEAAIDPVCRMQVDPAVDTIEAMVDDVRYIFCSVECRDAFVSRPEDYAVRGGAGGRSGHGQA
jgi:class 3 adenylate cyclase/YHS domain-containing protein